MDATTATTIIDQLIARLRIILRSSPWIEPGQPVNLSLVPAAHEISVTDLVEGALNLAWTGKNVIHENPDLVMVHDATNFHGDELAKDRLRENDSSSQVLGGIAFPAPSPLTTASTTPTTTNITGLFGQIFGSLDLREAKLKMEIKWTVHNQDGVELAEGKELIGLSGLTSPDVSLLMLPPFGEARLDNLEKPAAEVRCIRAHATITLAGVTKTVPVGPVPVLALPLLLPTVVAIGRHPDFSNTASSAGATLVLVPKHSPFSSLEELNDEIGRVRSILSSLTRLAKIGTFLLGLRSLNFALNAPYIRFFARDRLDKFSEFEIGSRLPFGFFSIDFDDTASACMVFGLPLTKVQFFNDTKLRHLPGSKQGMFEITVGPQMFVIIRDLKAKDADGKPIPFPNLALADYGIPEADVLKVITDFEPDQIDNDFNDSMSSVSFDKDWLGAMAGEVVMSRERAPSTLAGVECKDPTPRRT